MTPPVSGAAVVALFRGKLRCSQTPKKEKAVPDSRFGVQIRTSQLYDSLGWAGVVMQCSPTHHSP